MNLPGFEALELDRTHKIWVGRLPDALLPEAEAFEQLWQMHPAEFPEITMHGRLVKTPRWQQAYGQNYHFSGRVSQALPVPSQLETFLHWTQGNVAAALNGLLLNWYDGRLGHYIGRHRDSVQNLIQGTPIATISLGEERTFRLRPWPAQTGVTPIDFRASNGTVIVIPWDTNRVFTHEVPASSRATGRRISLTLRGFLNGLAG